jgi:hypothetical protein
MTKIYTLVAIIFITHSSFGQIRKNAFLLGGQLYYGEQKNFLGNGFESQKSTNATFQVSVGKAIKENTVVGINLRYSPSQYKTTSTTTGTAKTTNNNYEAGIFYKKYKSLGSGFYFTGQAEAAFGMNINKTDQTLPDLDSKVTAYSGSIHLSPGLSYQVLKFMHIELSLPSLLSISYSSSKEDYENPALMDRKMRSFGITSALSNLGSLQNIGIGFRLIF